MKAGCVQIISIDSPLQTGGRESGVLCDASTIRAPITLGEAGTRRRVLLWPGP